MYQLMMDWKMRVFFLELIGNRSMRSSFERDFSFSNEALNVEKKLRVEDYRLLRQRFNRSAADSAELSNKPADRAASMFSSPIYRSSFFLISFRIIE